MNRGRYPGIARLQEEVNNANGETRACIYFERPLTAGEKKTLLEAIVTAREFDFNCPVRCAPKPLSLKTEVPHEFRLATTFLHQLGRNYAEGCFPVQGDWDRPNDSQVIWSVALREPLDQLPEGNEIVIDAAHVAKCIVDRPKQECLPEERRTGSELLQALLSDAPLKRPFGPERGINKKSVADLYGPGKFVIDVKELQKLERSTRIRLGRHLPSQFYRELVRILCNGQREHEPKLKWTAWQSWPQTPGGPQARAVPQTPVMFYYHYKATPFAEFLAAAKDRNSRSDLGQCRLAELLLRVELNPYDFGFSSIEDFTSLLQLSQVELASEVCISQEGYFFVDGDNQITKRPKRAIHFVVATAPDFAKSQASQAELHRYFNLKTEEFGPGGESRLKERMRDTYSNILLSCKSMGITHPSFVAMGLGVFLPRKHSKIVQLIMHLYYEVLFDLLADPENDYGFEAFYLNPAQAKFVVQELLHNGYAFPHPVIIHFMDAKGVAINLASQDPPVSTSWLCPSDAVTMLQGRMGHWWEIGHDAAYSDWASTSTIMLAHRSITTAFSDLERMTYLADDLRSMSGSNGTMRGALPELVHLEEETQYWEEINLPVLVDQLRSQLNRHQPKDLLDFILRWALDQLLLLWGRKQGAQQQLPTSDFTSDTGLEGPQSPARPVDDPLKARRNTNTITMANDDAFKQFMRSLRMHFDNELRINRTGAMLMLTQAKLKGTESMDGRSLEEAERALQKLKDLHHWASGPQQALASPNADTDMIDQEKLAEKLRLVEAEVEEKRRAERPSDKEILTMFRQQTDLLHIKIDNFQPRYDVPLIWALENGQPQLASTLITSRAEVNLRWLGDNSPLHIAILHQHTAPAIAMIKAGAKCNVVNHHQEAPLHLSTECGLEAVSLALVQRPDVRVNLTNQNGSSPLCLAISHQQTQTALRLMDRPDIDINGRDAAGDSPIQYCLKYQRQDLLSHLLDPEYRHYRKVLAGLTGKNKEGLDAIHYAMKYCTKDSDEAQRMLQLIDKEPSDYDLPIKSISDLAQHLDNEDNTYLHWAFREEKSDLVKYLVGKGFSLTAVNKAKHVPQQYISKYDLISLASFLKQKKFLDAAAEGTTKTHEVSIKGDLLTLKRLVEFEGMAHTVWSSTAGAQGTQGLTPLQCALHRNHPHIVRYLLEQLEKTADTAGKDVSWDWLCDQIERFGNGRLKRGLEAVIVGQESYRSVQAKRLEADRKFHAQIQEVKKRSMPKSQRADDSSFNMRAREKEDMQNGLLSRSGASGSRHENGITGLDSLKDLLAYPSEPIQLYPKDYHPRFSVEEFISGPAINTLLPPGRTGSPKWLLPHMLQQAKLYAYLRMQTLTAAEQASGLTESDLQAIYIFTYESPIYRMLNQLLMKNEALDLAPWTDFLYHLIEGLKKLAPVKQQVFRGITYALDPAKWEEMYSVGSTVTWYNFSSASAEKGVVEGFLGDNNYDATLFIINHFSGRKIASFSFYPDEEEVLFLPGSRFKVKNVIGEDTARILNLSSKVVELEEVSSRGRTPASSLRSAPSLAHPTPL
mmetsp:Transcript_143485/g.250451  ORF Transcript_143485/g.250451 Transcript_143485/m.250451 type:complete len:1549 (-) Transcript_143485:370-5016(-)